MLGSDVAPGEQIRATVRLLTSVRSAGEAGGTRTSPSRRYLEAFLPGVEVGERLRHDLGQPWFTVTDQRALFHTWKTTAVRPSPGDFTAASALVGLWMHWADLTATGVRYRMMVLHFADGRFLIGYSPLGSQLRKKKNWDDEADAMVAAFGDRAIHVDLPR